MPSGDAALAIVSVDEPGEKWAPQWPGEPEEDEEEHGSANVRGGEFVDALKQVILCVLLCSTFIYYSMHNVCLLLIYLIYAILLFFPSLWNLPVILNY
jgi:hypothetical protein